MEVWKWGWNCCTAVGKLEVPNACTAPQTLRSRSKKTGGRGVPGAMRSECSCAVPAAARYRYSAVDARVAAGSSTGYPHRTASRALNGASPSMLVLVTRYIRSTSHKLNKSQSRLLEVFSRLVALLALARYLSSYISRSRTADLLVTA